MKFIPIKRALASAVAASLLVVSPGLGAYEAAARVLVAPVSSVQTGVGGAGTAGAAAVGTPSLNATGSAASVSGVSLGAVLPSAGLIAPAATVSPGGPTAAPVATPRTAGKSVAAPAARPARHAASPKSRAAAASPARKLVRPSASPSAQAKAAPASVMGRALSVQGRVSSLSRNVGDLPAEGARGAGRKIFDLVLGRRSIRGASLGVTLPTRAPGSLGRNAGLRPSLGRTAASVSPYVPAPAGAGKGRTVLRRLAQAGLAAAGLLGIGQLYGYLLSGLAFGPATLAWGVYAGALTFWSIVASICAHEAAHAWTAEKVGDVSARMAGQVSLNPLRYMNAASATMLFFTSLFGIPFGFFFAVMQNKLGLAKHKGKMAKVALAGPVMNIILTAGFAALIIGVKLAVPGLAAAPWIGGTLRIFALASVINLLLGASNLIPLGPLDGQKVARAAVPDRAITWFDRITVGIGLVIMLGGMAWLVISNLMAPGGGGGGTVVGQTGNPMVMTLAAFGAAIWVASLIPWLRSVAGRVRDGMRRKKMLAAGGYEITLKRSILANKAPVRAQVEGPVAVPWAGKPDAERPSGTYSLDSAVDGAHRGAVIDQDALDLNTGETVLIDDVVLDKVRAGRLVLLRRHVEKLSGPAFALLPAESFGGPAAARRIVETNAAATAVNYGMEGREILTSEQVRVVRAISTALGAPVYELTSEEKLPASREDAILADTSRGQAYFIPLTVIADLAELSKDEREARIEETVFRLDAMREKPAPGILGRALTPATSRLSAAAARLKDWLKFVLTPRKIAVRFKRATVISAGGLNIEAAVTTDDIRATLDELDLRLVRAEAGGLLHVAPKTKADPRVLARKLEASPLVLYASAHRSRAPRSRRLTLEFHRSILVDFGGFYAEVGTKGDDIAEVLRKHGLRVRKALSDLAFEVAVPRGRKAKDLAAKIAEENFVKAARAFPARRLALSAAVFGGLLLHPTPALAAGASPAGLVAVGLLAAVGIGLFIYNMIQAGKGLKKQRRLETLFSAYRHAVAVRDKYESLLLELPGAKVVGLRQKLGGAWELVVYFKDRASMERAWIASSNLEGVPVRKDVAGVEAVREILSELAPRSQAEASSERRGHGILTRIILNTVAVLVAGHILPGVVVADLTTAIVTGIVLGLVNALVKPFLVLLSAPLIIATLGLFYLVVAGLTVLIAGALVPGFTVATLGSGILFAIIVALVNSLTGNTK